MINMYSEGTKISYTIWLATHLLKVGEISPSPRVKNAYPFDSSTLIKRNEPSSIGHSLQDHMIPGSLPHKHSPIIISNTNYHILPVSALTQITTFSQYHLLTEITTFSQYHLPTQIATDILPVPILSITPTKT